MSARWVLLAGGVFVAGCTGELSTTGDEGHTPEPHGQIQEKIVGGRLEPGYPAVGALLGPEGSLCTATVVAPRWILTAAHCFERGDAGFSFVLGSDVQRPARRLGIAATWVHPAYDRRAIANDIALAQIDGDPGVEPMALVDSLDGQSGAWLTFVGFGLTSGNGWEMGQKRSVRMPIAQLEATTFLYAYRGRNTCGGDSGGPAFLEVDGVPRVAGVTSYGDQACRQYGVDTRVDAYRDWIRQVVGDDGAPEPVDPCGGLDYLGECDGDVSRWCEDGTVRQRDCAASGQACGWIDDQVGHYCRAAADPCDGLDYLGRCDGTVAEWCQDGEYQAVDCADHGQRCGYVNASVGYYCRR